MGNGLGLGLGLIYMTCMLHCYTYSMLKATSKDLVDGERLLKKQVTTNPSTTRMSKRARTPMVTRTATVVESTDAASSAG